MATQTLFINSYSGLTGTLTIKTFAPGSDAVVDSAIASPGTNNPSQYSASFTDLPALRYLQVLYSDSDPVASSYINVLAVTDSYFPESVQDTPTSVPTGARTVTVTVSDGVNPLENATVRFTEGANTYTVTTDVTGVGTINLDDATYVVAVTKASYAYPGTTLLVDGDETPTYTMSAISVTLPVDPNQSTGTIRCYDEEGSVEMGATVSVQIQNGPGTAGLAYDSAVWTETSDINGDASFVGLVQGAVYRAYRGTETNETQYFEFQVPVGRSSFLITELVGA